MRSATNPGGKFGDWVKEDFIPDEYLALSKEPDKQFGKVWEKRTDCAECNGSGIMDLMSCIYCEGFGYRTRYFVPSRIQDNPSIDMAEYLRSLINLPPVERYRLEKGDWTVSELGDLFKPEWVRYYHRRGDHFILARPDQADIIVPINELTTFVTADTASKEKTTSDFTCISSWGYHQRSGSLILIHALMTRMEVPRIADAILAQSSACRAEFVMIEDAQCGIGVIQELRGPKGKGIAIQNYNPNGVDKIARSTTAQVKMAAGQIFFPSGQPGWLVEPYAQLLGFPQASHDDFVDTVSMAASWVQSRHYISCGSTPGILEPVGRYLSFDTVHGITTYRAR
jgi:predicted phage terminase large subunit-like protein